MIARQAGDDALVARIREELERGPFTVTEQDGAAGADDLAKAARAHGAQAALRVQREPIGVELWTVQPSGDPAGAYEVIREPGASRHEQEVLVLRVVETLRALGLGFAEAEVVAPSSEPAPSPEPKPAPAPEAERIPAPEPAATPAAQAAAASTEAPLESTRVPQLWLELAPALTLSPGALGPQLKAQLGARYQAWASFSIAGFALAPLWRSALADEEGAADVSTWIVGLAGDVHYAVRPFELSAGLGLAGVITMMSGQGTAELDDAEETERTAAPFVRAALSFELAAWLRLCLRALLGASVPEVSVRFVDREIATWGQPFVVVGLGLELPVIAHAASQ